MLVVGVLVGSRECRESILVRAWVRGSILGGWVGWIWLVRWVILLTVEVVGG